MKISMPDDCKEEVKTLIDIFLFIMKNTRYPIEKIIMFFKLIINYVHKSSFGYVLQRRKVKHLNVNMIRRFKNNVHKMPRSGVSFITRLFAYLHSKGLIEISKMRPRKSDGRYTVGRYGYYLTLEEKIVEPIWEKKDIIEMFIKDYYEGYFATDEAAINALIKIFCKK